MAGLIVGLIISEGMLRVAAKMSSQISFFCRDFRDDAFVPHADLSSFLHHFASVPHKDWRGYYNNSWGMNDTEFSPDPAKYQIMVLGDSQAYGMVAYPHNAFTIAEKLLRDACPDNEPEILNLGVPSTGVYDYKNLFELTGAKLKPDAVLLNIYMGNDLPDTYHKKTRQFPRNKSFQIYLHNLVRNVSRYLRGLDRITLPPKDQGIQHKGSSEKIGGLPSGSQLVTDDSQPPLSGPTFNTDGWNTILRNEINSLYVGHSPEDIEASWRPLYHALDLLYEKVTANGSKLFITLFPSEVQVSVSERRRAFEYVVSISNTADLNFEDFDPRLPVRMMLGYCRANALLCLDLTPVIEDASLKSKVYVSQDTHLNIGGNALVGHEIGKFLAQNICLLKQG